MVYTKGADSSVLKICNLTDSKRNKLQQKANDMANKSYRAMIFAMRELDSKEAFDYQSM